MLNRLSKKLAMRLVNNKIISYEDIDIYIYGFELLLSFLFSTLLILCIGTIFDCLVETIVFLIIFILLRSFSGGYHALTYSFCTFVTLSLYGTTMLLSYYTQINYISFFIIASVGIISLSIFAPVINPNKEISSKKAIQHKITSILLFAFFCTAGIVLHKKSPILSNTFFYSLCADILLLFPKNIKKQKKGGSPNVNNH